MVSLDRQNDIASVLDENERLKRRAQRQTAIIRLLVVLLELSGFRFDEQRLPEGKAEARVLRAVDQCTDALTLKSATTRAKLARQRGWRRPRRRVYPEKPKTGIRATYPNDYWHIDVTVIRLVDDTKAHLHAVIDNFSCRILAWHLAERRDPNTTCEILKEAGKNLDRRPTVIADSGVENVNDQVDQIIADGVVHRVLAQLGSASAIP